MMYSCPRSTAHQGCPAASTVHDRELVSSSTAQLAGHVELLLMWIAALFRARLPSSVRTQIHIGHIANDWWTLYSYFVAFLFIFLCFSRVIGSGCLLLNEVYIHTYIVHTHIHRCYSWARCCVQAIYSSWFTRDKLILITQKLKIIKLEGTETQNTFKAKYHMKAH